MADVQYANRENHGTRYYRSSLKKLTEAVDMFNQEKTDFVVHLGDFINDSYESFDTLNSITGKLKMPLYHVVGNHDFEVEDDKKGNVLNALKLKNDYYSFEKKNWKFVVLYGNDISLIANAQKSSEYKIAKEIFDSLKAEGAPAAKPWNGTLSKEQINWMKKELSDAVRKKQKVILLCHFPLYPDGSPQILWNPPTIRKIVEGCPNVKAYLNGHVHVSQYFLKNKIHYVSFKGMVEKEENAFAIVSVFKDHLEIKGYGKEVDRILK
jgi:predicted phosphodiesterase